MHNASYISLSAIKKTALEDLEASIRADYDRQIKEQVENVITLLERKNQELQERQDEDLQ